MSTRTLVGGMSARRCQVENCDSLAVFNSPYCRRCGGAIEGEPVRQVSNFWTFLGVAILLVVGWILINDVVGIVRAVFQ